MRAEDKNASRLKGRELWLLSAACLLLALLAAFSSFGILAERHWYDLHAAWLPAHKADQEVLLVGLDDISLDLIAQEQKGLKWPYPRAMHAQVLRHLGQAGAKAVFLDLIFDLPSGFGPKDDQALAAAITRIPTVISSQQSRETKSPPLPLFLEAGALVGTSELPFDRDGMIRHMWGARAMPDGYKTALYYFLGLDRQDSSGTALSAGQAMLSLARAGSPQPEPGYISFAGPPQTMPFISYYQVYNPTLFATVSGYIKDRLIFLGSMTSVSHTPQGKVDHYITPAGGGLMSGVEIQTNIMQTLLSGRVKHLLAGPAWLALLLLFCAAYTWAIAGMDSMRNGLAAMLAGLAAVEGTALLFWSLDLLFLPLTGALFCIAFFIGSACLRFLAERRARLVTKACLFRYLPAPVASHVLADPKHEALGAEQAKVTVLFADIAGFATLSEHLPPEDLILLLQDHLQHMTEIIFRQSGTLDKYMGDGIMAFWGAPVSQSDQAVRALRAAREMLAEVERSNREKELRGAPHFNMRVGLHYGNALVGNIGSDLFIDYTVIGDTVNTANRVERVNKYFGTWLCLTEAFKDALDGGDDLPLAWLGRVALAGYQTPLDLYTTPEKGQAEAYKDLAHSIRSLPRKPALAAELIKSLQAKWPGFAPLDFYWDRLDEASMRIDDEGRPYWRLLEK